MYGIEGINNSKRLNYMSTLDTRFDFELIQRMKLVQLNVSVRLTKMAQVKVELALDATLVCLRTLKQQNYLT